MLKVVSVGGDSHGTKIIDPKTGVDLCEQIGVTAITIKMEVDQPVTMTADFIVLEAEIEVDKVVAQTRNPRSGLFEPVAAIEFQDGTRVEFSEQALPVVREKSTPAQELAERVASALRS